MESLVSKKEEPWASSGCQKHGRVRWDRKSWPKGNSSVWNKSAEQTLGLNLVQAENYPCPLLIGASGETAGVRESSPWRWRQSRASELTNPAPTQVQNWVCEMAHPNIHPTYDLLEHVQEPVLQAQSCKISMTQGNNRISNVSPSERPVSIK